MIFIVVQLLQKFNDADLDFIKTENLHNARRHVRVFGVKSKGNFKQLGMRFRLHPFLCNIRIQRLL